jgi:hypothetical protein
MAGVWSSFLSLSKSPPELELSDDEDDIEGEGGDEGASEFFAILETDSFLIGVDFVAGATPALAFTFLD